MAFSSLFDPFSSPLMLAEVSIPRSSHESHTLWGSDGRDGKAGWRGQKYKGALLAVPLAVSIFSLLHQHPFTRVHAQELSVVLEL